MELELTEFDRNIKRLEDLGYKAKHLTTPDGKAANFQVKDFSLQKNEVAFYFSIFNNKDSDGDIILPGSFTKTITEQRSRIKYLYNHNTTQSPGVVKELGEDTVGAFAVCTFYESPHIYGPHVREEYLKGGLTEHSMGYRALVENYDAMQQANVISEIKLWEISGLTCWGANPMTRTLGVKGQKGINAKIIELLSKKQLTEEQYILVETYIKSLEIAKETAPVADNFANMLKCLSV